MSDNATNDILPEFAGFFDHARQQRLAFPYCRSCGQFHWYPMPRCPHCRGSDIEWRQVSGRGTLFSFTRVMHAFDKSRADALPYVVALVEFADAPGVRLITNIIDSPHDELRIGQSVAPVFRLKDGRAVVEFRTV
jgi:uncharacterized protein